MRSKIRVLAREPVYLGFAVLYLAAVVLRGTAGLGNLAVYVGMDVALLGLLYLIYHITRKREPIAVQHREPGLELAIGLMTVEVAWRVFPSLVDLKWWDAGAIIEKNVIELLLVTAICWVRGSSLWNWRATRKNLWRDIGLGFVVFVVVAVPSAFYAGTAGAIQNGSLKPQWLPGLLGVSFVHKVLYSGLHEEVFFRGFVQARLASALKNEWHGLVAAALYFGLLHTMGNRSWGYDAGIMGGFTESMFVQTIHGLMFGMLWMRTKSVVPGVIVHSGMNAVTNLAAAARNLGWL